MSDEIQQLTARYLNLYPAEPVSDETIRRIETTLELVLPSDLKKISKVYSGGILGLMAHFEIRFGPADNIVDETQKLRQNIGLLHKYIHLATPAAGFVLMATEAEESKPTAVTWLCEEDIFRVAEGEEPIYDTDIYSSYAEFFAFLIADEEESRAWRRSRLLS